MAIRQVAIPTASVKVWLMSRDIQVLILAQEQVIQCRRLAALIADPKTVRRLNELADEIEQCAREADRQQCSPE